MSNIDLKDFLQKFPEWKINGTYLERHYALKSYFKGLSFVQSVGWLAQKYQHHPDITLTFSDLKIRLTTHNSGNAITHKDISMAEQIENLWF